MKLLKVKRHYLHNEEWFMFYTDFKNTVRRYGAVRIGIGELFSRFIPLYKNVDRLIEITHKSIYTKEMKEVDKNRDTIFRAFIAIAKNMQIQSDTVKKNSAAHLHNLLDSYSKKIVRGSYNEETSAISLLLQELEDRYAADVDLLNLEQWVDDLRNANQNFNNLFNTRTQETIDKPKENLFNYRRKIDMLYSGIEKVLDAKLVLDNLSGNRVVNPESLDTEVHEEGESFDPLNHGNIVYNFVIDWNERAKTYRTLANLHLGRRAKDKSQDSDELID
ncbi:MAG: DUF6261 family protein [Tannerellaceae bacterium]|nr:DUF6261 family protein [Tannerellaceae bacterium]